MNLNAINQYFRDLGTFKESFQVLDFFIHPHMMHINVGIKGQGKKVKDQPFHTHRTFELSMVLEGSMEYILDTKVESVIINKGDFIIIPNGVRHRWIAKKESLIFNMMLFISKNGEGSRQDMEQLLQSIHLNRNSIKEFKILEKIAREILDEAQHERTGSEEKLIILTRLATVEIFRALLPNMKRKPSATQRPPQRGDKNASVVELIRFYVQDNLSRPIKLREISDHLGFSVNHLGRIFKSEHGNTIQEYIIHTKLSHAKDLLAQTDRPLKEISAAVGYDDVNYFCRLFKKYQKTTPSSFRRNC